MRQSSIENKIVDILKSIFTENGIEKNEIPLNQSLYEDGIGLDSLDTATFSVMLERAFGSDPYTEGQFPQTVADIINYYAQKQER